MGHGAGRGVGAPVAPTAPSLTACSWGHRSALAACMLRSPAGEPMEEGDPQDHGFNLSDEGQRFQQGTKVHGADGAVSEWGAMLGCCAYQVVALTLGRAGSPVDQELKG